MSIVPSAPPDASGTVRGFVNLMAQTFAGAKTFLATIVASAGIQVASLFNTNGTGASDVAVKVGTSTADGSVNASAHLVEVSTGIGGSESKKFWVTKSGPVITSSQSFELNGDGGGVKLGFRPGDGLCGFHNGASSYLGWFPGTGAAACSGGFTVGGTLYVAGNLVGDSGGTPRIRFLGGTPTLDLLGSGGAGASDVLVKAGTATADGSVNTSAKIFSVRSGIGGTETEYAYWTKVGGGSLFTNFITLPSDGSGFLRVGLQGIYGNNVSGNLFFNYNTFSGTSPVIGLNCSSGLISQSGTDDSANAGNRTVNKPTGINKLANGATTCTITNSLCSATSRVMVTFHDDPGARYWVTRAAGSFTVNLSAAAGADKVFSWEVANIL